MAAPRRVVSGLVVALAAVGLLTACTGKDAVDSTSNGQFRFIQSTAKGGVIPVAQRKTAGDITGTLLDGKSFALTQDAGKPTVINWFASWCGPCQTETPAFAQLYNQIKGGTDFVGIDSKDNRSSGQSFVAANDVTYPVVYDYELKSALQIGSGVPARSLPFTAIVDKHGKVAAVYLTAVQPADLQNALSQLASES